MRVDRLFRGEVQHQTYVTCSPHFLDDASVSGLYIDWAALIPRIMGKSGFKGPVVAFGTRKSCLCAEQQRILKPNGLETMSKQGSMLT